MIASIFKLSSRLMAKERRRNCENCRELTIVRVDGGVSVGSKPTLFTLAAYA